MSAAAEIAAGLAARIEGASVLLVGQQPTLRTRTQWRFYPRGGLVVNIAGPRRGIWCHHGEGGVGGDALDLVKHFRRCSTAEAIQWARDFLGQPDPEPPPSRASTPEPDQERDPTARAEAARRIWIESVDPAGTPAEAYLAHRGLHLPDAPVLRFHPRCPSGKDRFPAMVALMVDPRTRQLTGIHRTFIQPDGRGKAEVPSPKMMLGHRGVVGLSAEWGEGLGLAEGIETSLAVTQRVGWGPCWAALCAGGIAAFPVLPATVLHVFGDHDRAGVKACRACLDTWSTAGRIAYAHFPARDADWLDVAGPKTLLRIDRAVIEADRSRP